MTFSVIGVPIDSVGRSGGTERAPAALRAMGLIDAIDGSDAGDLDVRIRGEERDPDTGIVGSADVMIATLGIRQAVDSSIRAGSRPFLAGGCCAELPGALAGARDAVGRLGLAYFDGHLDLYDGVTSPTGEAADMPVAAALGLGPQAWVQAAGGPSISADDTAIVGYRDLEQSLADGMIDPDSLEGLTHVDVEAVRSRGPGAVGIETERALSRTPGRFWLHLDVDVLDETVFPATDYLFSGGMEWSELLDV
ncbi:MAG TPA: arginase family protein, partial [Actinomycetota bacterium]